MTRRQFVKLLAPVALALAAGCGGGGLHEGPTGPVRKVPTPKQPK
jgi:anaerobic selenocysteine-containing dehydrogenase